MGAGFTVYDRDKISSKIVDADIAMIWNELFVSDIDIIRSFYSELFSWTLVSESD